MGSDLWPVFVNRQTADEENQQRRHFTERGAKEKWSEGVYVQQETTAVCVFQAAGKSEVGRLK